MTPEVVLASSSLVRKEVLDRLRVVYAILPSQFEEKMKIEADESFDDLARHLALGKARSVAGKVKNAIVIGADSFAVFDGEILGKPHTNDRATDYLSRLSGKTHEFYTGMAVVDTGTKRETADCVKAKVRFRNLTAEEIRQYVEKEEVKTAAGGYRIQGLGATLIEEIVGDYYAVVGLSPSKLQEMLLRLGYNLFNYIAPLR